MKVTWKLQDGREIMADVAAGTTIKDAGMANNVPHILGECGGCMSCATCHVVVDPDWISAVGMADEMENEILDTTEAPRQENSRLSCQITMSEALDGLKLLVPQA